MLGWMSLWLPPRDEFWETGVCGAGAIHGMRGMAMNRTWALAIGEVLLSCAELCLLAQSRLGGSSQLAFSHY